MPALKELLIWIESHPGTAAWVQAIGAIVALAIAIGVPVCMARRADRLNRKRPPSGPRGDNQKVGRVARERSGLLLLSALCGPEITSGTESLLTLRWRGMDSNFRYRGRRPASGRSLRAQRVETDAAKGSSDQAVACLRRLGAPP